jgi:hypothetical protein
MYKLVKNDSITGKPNNTVIRLLDGACIPFDPDNRDFANFKNQIQGIGESGASIEPVELQDADGNTMTAAEAKAFVATLP